jgi:hypothetical protein
MTLKSSIAALHQLWPRVKCTELKNICQHNVTNMVADTLTTGSTLPVLMASTSSVCRRLGSRWSTTTSKPTFWTRRISTNTTRSYRFVLILVLRLTACKFFPLTLCLFSTLRRRSKPGVFREPKTLTNNASQHRYPQLRPLVGRYCWTGWSQRRHSGPDVVANRLALEKSAQSCKPVCDTFTDFPLRSADLRHHERTPRHRRQDRLQPGYLGQDLADRRHRHPQSRRNLPDDLPHAH